MITGEPYESDLPVDGTSEAAFFVDQFIQHGPGVERALVELQKARDLDSSLRKGTEGNHPLSRRFTVFSGGNDNYPFMHYKVSLKPKKGVPILGVEGLVMRFGVEMASEGGYRFNGVIGITYGIQRRTSAEYILTDTSWEPYAHPDELDVEGTVIKGIKSPRGNSEFDALEFNSLLEDMEAELQTNLTQQDLI